MKESQICNANIDYLSMVTILYMNFNKNFNILEL